MPRVALTYHQKAQNIVKDLKRAFLGKKTELGLSWEEIAEEMGMPRTTLTYKWKHNTLMLNEWYELSHILGVKEEDVL